MCQKHSSKLILGGSFNPIHYGHIWPAQEAASTLGIDKITLLPNRVSPLKQGSISSEHKLAMLNLVKQAQPIFEIDPRELNKQQANYTIDTLKELRQEQAHSALCFLMGMDTLITLPHWHCWQELLDYAHLVVCKRPEQNKELPNEVQQMLAEHGANKIIGLHGKIIMLDTKMYPISSTQIRHKIKNKQSCQGLLPQSIERYLIQNQLYSNPSK